MVAIEFGTWRSGRSGGAAVTEPPRDFRRLQLLRKWSHDEADEQQVFT